MKSKIKTQRAILLLYPHVVERQILVSPPLHLRAAPHDLM